jgi:hypothetical protein
MKKLMLALLLFLALVPLVNAFCPVCTIAVAVGVGVLREWGVDDILTGLWYGALIVSSIAWFIGWLDKKNIHFLFRKILVIVSFIALFIWPLYWFHIMGIPGNTALGIDRLLFGTIIGGIVFLFSAPADAYLRKINEGQVAFPYQKVVVPVVFMICATFIAYYLLIIMG